LFLFNELRKSIITSIE